MYFSHNFQIFFYEPLNAHSAAATMLAILLCLAVLFHPMVARPSHKLFAPDDIRVEIDVTTVPADLHAFPNASPTTGAVARLVNTGWGLAQSCAGCKLVHAETREEFPYCGPIYKVESSAPKTFDVLHPRNRALIASFHSARHFCVTKTGAYEVHVHGTVEICSSETNCWPRRVDYRGMMGVFSVEGTGGPQFEVQVGSANCTIDEDAILSAAVASATTEIAHTVDFFTSGCKGCDYSLYMGLYEQTRYARVLNGFANMKATLEADSIFFKCNGALCASNSIAYVYGSLNDNKIYLCDRFWSLPASITIDSRPGTIIHELSHFHDMFTLYDGTEDHRYGPTACRNLAKTEPHKAVDNADSYEYTFESSLRSSGCDTNAFCSSLYAESSEGIKSRATPVDLVFAMAAWTVIALQMWKLFY